MLLPFFEFSHGGALMYKMRSNTANCSDVNACLLFDHDLIDLL